MAMTTKRLAGILVLFMLVFAGPPSPVSGEEKAARLEGSLDLGPVPYRSPSTAVWLSLGATVGLAGSGILLLNWEPTQPAGGVLLLSGISLGPSVGHFYTGHWGRGLLFAGARSVTTFAAFVAILAEAMDGIGNQGEQDSSDGNGGRVAAGFMLATAGLAMWETIDVYFAAQRFNEEASSARFSLAPTVLPIEENGTVRPAWGLTLQAAF